MMNLQTEFAFTLPRGYVDAKGVLHRQGIMRLATAMDEIAPLSDPRVRANQAYLSVLLLARVVIKLGSLSTIETAVIEGLFASDLAYLQLLYRQINEQGMTNIEVACQRCQGKSTLNLADWGELLAPSTLSVDRPLNV